MGETREASPGRAAAGVPWRVRGAVLLAALVPTGIVVLGSNSVRPGSYLTDTSDALVFRAVAELLCAGESPYPVDRLNEHIARTRLNDGAPPYDLPFLYPPNALPIFVIYAIGGPFVGYALFSLSGGLLWLLAAEACARRHVRRRDDYILTVLASGFFGAALFNARLGQTGTFAAAVVVLYVTWYERRPFAAGVCLGLLTCKPQYAVFLATLPLVQRRWRILFAAGGVFGALSVGSAAFFGVGLWGDFAHALGQKNQTLTDMCNWYALVLLFSGQVPADLQRWGMWVMAGGAAVVAGVHYARRGLGRDNARSLAWTAALAPVLSANTHPYDLCLWLVPICWVCCGGRVRVWWAWGPLGVLFVYLPRFEMPLVSLFLAGLVGLRRVGEIRVDGGGGASQGAQP